MRSLFWGLIQSAVQLAASRGLHWDYFTGSDSCIITSAGAWSHDASTVPAWITVTNGSGMSGDSFTCTASQNSGYERSGNIKLWLTNDHSNFIMVNVFQESYI